MAIAKTSRAQAYTDIVRSNPGIFNAPSGTIASEIERRIAANPAAYPARGPVRALPQVQQAPVPPPESVSSLPPPGTLSTSQIGQQYGTTDKFTEAIQTIMKNRAGIQATTAAGFQGVQGLNRDLSAMPGFSGLTYNQAQGMSKQVEGGYQGLLSQGLGAADIARRRIEDITQQQASAEKASSDRAAAEAKATSDKSQQTFNNIDKIQGNIRLDPDIKDFIQTRDGYERVQTGAVQQNGQGDLALLFGYMKMLDPNSTVREGEFASAQEAMGYAQKLLNLPQQWISGDRLTPDARKQFADSAQKLYSRKEASYLRAADFYGKQADQYGIPRDMVLRDFGTTANNPAEVQAAARDQQVNAGIPSGQGNRPQRNNNPANIKVPQAGIEEAKKRYNDPGATIDPVPATDGGYFIKFSSPDKGMGAISTLLQGGYSGLSLDAAMKRWSNSGYGKEIAPELGNKTIGQLSPSEMNTLVQRMITREGFYAGNTNSKSSPTGEVTLISPSGDRYTWPNPNDPEIQEAMKNGYKSITQ